MDFLRDTGSNVVIVSRDLVDGSCMTGGSSRVYLVDRTARWLPEARVHIEALYFTGIVMAKCMDNPLYDLILGNYPGVELRLQTGKEVVEGNLGFEKDDVSAEDRATRQKELGPTDLAGEEVDLVDHAAAVVTRAESPANV